MDMSDMDKMQEKITNELAEVSKLMDNLNMSIKLRKVFNIPQEGTVSVRHIKPSGVSEGDWTGYKTHIIHNSEVISIIPMKEFKRLMDGGYYVKN